MMCQSPSSFSSSSTSSPFSSLSSSSSSNSSERDRLNGASSAPSVLNAGMLRDLIEEDPGRGVGRPPRHPLQLSQPQEKIRTSFSLLLPCKPSKLLRHLFQLLLQLLLLCLQ